MNYTCHTSHCTLRTVYCTLNTMQYTLHTKLHTHYILHTTCCMCTLNTHKSLPKTLHNSQFNLQHTVHWMLCTAACPLCRGRNFLGQESNHRIVVVARYRGGEQTRRAGGGEQKEEWEEEQEEEQQEQEQEQEEEQQEQEQEQEQE